jgi:hypothetical protein
MCGDACVEMLRECLQLSFPAIDMNHNPRGAVEGAGADDLLRDYGNYLRKYTGFQSPTALTGTGIRDALKIKGPIMCSGNFVRLIGKVRSGHWILLIGIDGSTLVIHDPWHGAFRRKPIDWFTSLLDTDECIVARTS